MYHIWAVQCQVQLGAGKKRDVCNFARFSGCFALQRRVQLALSIRRGIRGVYHRHDIAAAKCRFDFGETRDHPAGFPRDRQRVERGAFR